MALFGKNGKYKSGENKDSTYVEANATEKMVAKMTPCERYGHNLISSHQVKDTGETRKDGSGYPERKTIMVCSRNCGYWE